MARGQVSIDFCGDQETIGEIEAYAKKFRVKRSRAMLELIELGLETLKLEARKTETVKAIRGLRRLRWAGRTK